MISQQQPEILQISSTVFGTQCIYDEGYLHVYDKFIARVSIAYYAPAPR